MPAAPAAAVTAHAQIMFAAVTAIAVHGLWRGRQLITVATQGRQAEHFLHNALPLRSVRPDATAIQFMRQQVRHFMGHGLAQEIIAVLLIQQTVEAQQVAPDMRNSCRLATQGKADLRPVETAGEMLLGQQVALLDPLHQFVGHTKPPHISGMQHTQLAAVVEFVFQRVDKGAHAQVFGGLELDIGINEVTAEYTAAQQKFAVFIQRLERFTQAAAHLRNMA